MLLTTFCLYVHSYRASTATSAPKFLSLAHLPTSRAGSFTLDIHGPASGTDGGGLRSRTGSGAGVGQVPPSPRVYAMRTPRQQQAMDGGNHLMVPAMHLSGTASVGAYTHQQGIYIY